MKCFRIIVVLLVLFGTVQALDFCEGITPSDIQEVLGEHTGIAVFRERDGVTLVSLTLPDLVVDTIIQEDTDLKHVRLSPDGNYVLYHSDGIIHMQGIGERKDEHYELGQGFFPQIWLDPHDGTEYLICGTNQSMTLLEPLGSATKYGGGTYRRRLQNHQFGGDIELMLDQGYKGGISQDGRWIGTAGRTPCLYDMENDTVYKLTIPSHRTSTCWPRINPTADPAEMDQISYLNCWHDTIVVKNSRDSVVWAFRYPDSLFGSFGTGNPGRKWHSHGWSNHEKFMLTGIRNDSLTLEGSEKRFYGVLVRRSDKAVVKICRFGAYQDLHIHSAPQYEVGVKPVSRIARNGKEAGTVRTRAALVPFAHPTGNGVYYTARGRRVSPAALKIPFSSENGKRSRTNGTTGFFLIRTE